MQEPLGLYLSIPFCRAKCTFCNFASDSFAPERLPLYLDALAREITQAPQRATRIGAELPRRVDTLYLGGGTPSLLSAGQVHALFATLRATFDLSGVGEATVECAPGQLAPATLEALQREGVDRLSFGVQSFVDRECSAIGRLHTGAQCSAEMARIRAAGIASVSLDLIAGLPHQTEASWQYSLNQAIASGADHISVYLLEIDEDSRLGRELLSSSARYSAVKVPSDEQAADLYEVACRRLEQAGLLQYEISNFARVDHRSRHNLKYWNRAPYLGFGLDAHSMLRSVPGPTPITDLRFANTDSLDVYLHAAEDRTGPGDPRTSPFPQFQRVPEVSRLTAAERFEETLFLGLRLNDGICTSSLAEGFAPSLVATLEPILAEAESDGLLTRVGSVLRLTPQGRLLSNELFSRFLQAA